MGFFDGIKRFLGFDDDEDDRKKKPQQQQRPNNSRQQSNAPRPGNIVLPTQRQDDPQKLQAPVKRPDNTISLVGQPDLPEVLKKAVQPKPKPQPKKDDGIMSNAEIAVRSAGSVGANVAGGLVGMAKGLVEVPGALLQTPKLVKIGAAKVTKNKVAENNAAKTQGNLEQWSDNYSNFVKPVTEPLKKMELATDKKALEVADWNTGPGKTIAKASANIIPIDGAAKLLKVTKAAKAGRMSKVAGVADEVPINTAPGVKSVNPTREADAAAQIDAEVAALPPAPQMDPVLRQQAALETMRAESPAAGSLRKVTPPAEPVPGQVPIRPLPEQQPGIVTRPPEDLGTPAYQARPAMVAAQTAADDAAIAAQRQPFDPLDAPAYQRRGIELDQNPEVIIDGLRNNATAFTRDPDFAEVVQEAYLQTGSNNPLSLAAAALSRTQDKGRVRAIVERLVPGVDGNALNRAVNQITGADDQTDVLEALQTAATRIRRDEPFGPVSDAPAPRPLEAGAEPVPATPVIPDTAELPTPVAQVGAEPTNTPRGEVGQVKEVTVVPGAEKNPYVPASFSGPLTKVEKPSMVKVTDNPATTNEVAPAKSIADKPLAKTPQKYLVPAKITAPAKSGEIGKSQGKYAKGQEYEKTSVEATRKRGSDEAANTSYDDFVKKVEGADGMVGKDRDTAVALQARHKPGSLEHRKLGDLINKYHTEAAQTLGTIERTLRKTADANRLTDNFVNKLYRSTDETIAISDSDFDKVIARNEAFVKARDNQNAAVEAFNSNPTAANADRVADAFKKVDEADRAAKFEEYKTAAKIVGKSKNPTAKTLVSKLERDAGVYTMDWVDSSMLSSTRVMINNFLNTLGVRGEEAMFGKAGAAIARKLTGTNIGGGSHKGAKLGAELGTRHWKSDAALRQGAQGNKLVKSIKNFTTTGNTVGDRNTYAAAYSGVFDHYKIKLKGEGYKGDELNRRAMVNSLTDPDDIAYDYMNQALANNAMSSIVHGPTGGKIETQIADMIATATGNSTAMKVAAKAVTRVTLGFPTVITRSLIQGTKRTSLGGISTIQAVKNVVTKGPKELTARHIKNAVKEAGSGAVMYSVGAGLGSAGLINGGYPTEKAEQERWKREGITENSIRIGDDYYSLPAALGVFALPFMIGANAAQNVREGKAITDDFLRDTAETIVNSMPIDSLQRTLDMAVDFERGRDVTKPAVQTASSLARSVTPLGSLLNQVAKMFDPNANDTTQGDAMAQFLAKIQDGIPGLANDLPDKTVAGKPVKNPGAIPRLFGAMSTSQKEGVERTAEIKQEGADQASKLKETGVFKDKLRNILDDDTKEIFDKAKSGGEVSPDDMKKLQSGLTKGVTETEDTRYLEDGDHDTNLAVLRAKKSILEAEPTTRKETLAAYDEQITRGEIYKEQKTKYETVKKYKDISLEEWRALGDPDSDDHDPDLYETLFDLDAAMTDKGVSRRSSDKTKPKYYAKTTKSGSGGGGRKSAADKAADAALRKIQSNTVSGVPDLKRVDLSDLRPQKLQSAQIPKIQQIKSSDLIKKRKITVSKA